jgi:hypothetical protein
VLNPFRKRFRKPLRAAVLTGASLLVAGVVAVSRRRRDRARPADEPAPPDETSSTEAKSRPSRSARTAARKPSSRAGARRTGTRKAAVTSRSRTRR